MNKALMVGDDITLPSGRRVEVISSASKSRPWVAVQTGFVWHVCRPRKVGDGTAASYYFDPAKPTPLQLDEADAIALAQALNSVQKSRRRARSP